MSSVVITNLLCKVYYSKSKTVGVRQCKTFNTVERAEAFARTTARTCSDVVMKTETTMRKCESKTFTHPSLK